MERNEYITDSQVVKRANAAVKIEIEKQKAMDNPIVIYDGETQTIYQEYSDGSRVVVGKKMREGRYSERVTEEA
ncbi:MAG: hypothetical protein IJA10_15565 [Lachnospiraceae bacterium]|nr:hypothetical protein [Lachnospiraceae bacterium]